ncbi:hypothetical protein L0128_13270 [candidate division KSB1 bacterium]|nr:hypothetical protein [candidate division KSB1 bacterium]
MIIPQTYHLLLATDYLYDADFIQLLEAAAQRQQLTTYIVRPANLEETYQRLQQRELEFKFFVDRASDSSPGFLKLNHFLSHHQIPILDSIGNLQRAADKATMHLEFLARRLMTPYTIIIAAYSTLAELPVTTEDLQKLGQPFFIKPANTTGGGIGVVADARTLQDVLIARQQYHHDKYLLQEKVFPHQIDGRRFWFRGFYFCGLVECSWWNDVSHVYEVLTAAQVEHYRLSALFSIVWEIARISHLNFFSTEIALNTRGEFVVIDYVNEVCDMRLKSRHFDGVPDEIVHRVANRIAAYTAEVLAAKNNPARES